MSRRGSISRVKSFSIPPQPVFRIGALSSTSSFASSNASTCSLGSKDGRRSRRSSGSDIENDEEDHSFDSSLDASELEETASLLSSLRRIPTSASSSASKRSRASLNSELRSSTSTRNTGSPITHARRSPTKFVRPRRQFLRAQSMFGNVEEITNPQAEPGPALLPASPIPRVPLTESSPALASPVAPVVGTQLTAALTAVMDNVEDALCSNEPRLPHHLPDDPTDSIPRITKETLIDVLDGKFSSMYDNKMVIDCRFEYEYEGGHIDGAVNHNNKELLAQQLFDTPIQGRSLLIFHCEYSAHRAPLMARHVRSRDREVNRENYPRLTYPEVYILEGGYKTFFEDQPSRCYPQNYVEMIDKAHERTCERELGRLKTKSRKAPGLKRAKTFAYGASTNRNSSGGSPNVGRSAVAKSPPSPESRRERRTGLLFRSPSVLLTPHRMPSFPRC
ncbi:hypothetical protein TD95_004988 [Thielaviopsis punctulata]|uniref:M-phase inducer phosphatase n=1 Tax=Thielaviopsis punctulata TaxID=72032 RepID=A0A0F4ZK65_9PEZI|nr:hypothetical protein TD95_004988 [Thielaviopsis punctulata]